MGEGFELEGVDRFVGEDAHLFVEELFEFVGVAIGEELVGGEEGTDGGEDVGVGLFGLVGELDGGAVDGFELVGEPVGLEFDAVGSEGVGFDEVGSGVDVLLV